ncbi:cilia- and flagella-associated protein 53-like [Tubulanus polymorphus]|uniref:cilia- and flagella-associated protein 53-like n=1 Tax=Tubulanus polymorphus TaxID=672921 RepID=UPI003DA2A3DD
MMMVAAGQRPKRCREVTGPSPNSVAIKAKPTNKYPPEKLILDRRHQEEMREKVMKQSQYQQMCDLRNDWERTTDRRIQSNTVRRRINDLLKAEEWSIEDRRERLREMLAAEEQQYVEEMEAKEETVLERQARMRDRAKQLKDKRETERLKYVEDKCDQLFRNQCEELRSTLSRRHQDEVCAERMEQLKIRDAIQDDLRKEEDMFARLWYEDMQAKAQREEKEAEKQMARNQECLQVLQVQRAALAAKKEEEKKLKEEEAELLKEQAELRKLEEEKKQEEKRRRRVEAKQLLDINRRLKMKKQAKEVQEQLAYDMQLMEKLLEESQNEALEIAQRKKELREEDRRYREYLKNMLEEEKIREKELDRLLDEEVEKMWQKRIRQWDLEAEAREKLLSDVMQTRKQQIEEKRRRNADKQIVAAREREEIMQAIEDNKRIEREQTIRARDKHHAHQNDLLDQIKYNTLRNEQINLEHEREYLLGEQAEREYQQKLRAALDNPYLDEKAHPMRKHRMMTDITAS